MFEEDIYEYATLQVFGKVTKTQSQAVYLHKKSLLHE
jgi:hypothetical protein